MSVNVNNVLPGSLVAFTYNRGSVPGSTRLVRVSGSDARHLNGEDLNAQADHSGSRYRNFLKSEIPYGAFRVIATPDEDAVPASDFLNPALLSTLDAATVHAAVAVMNPNAKILRYDAESKMVIVKKEKTPFVEVEFTANEMTINYRNINDQTLGLSFKGDFKSMVGTVKCPVKQDELTSFAVQLVPHIRDSQNQAVSVSSSNIPSLPKDNESWSEYCDRQAKAGNPLYAGNYGR